MDKRIKGDILYLEYLPRVVAPLFWDCSAEA